jgi:hypothetical protein
MKTNRQSGPASWFTSFARVAVIAHEVRRDGAVGQGSQAERLRAGSDTTGIPTTLPNFRVWERQSPGIPNQL